MSEEIYIDDLECPYCDADTESWDIKVDQNQTRITLVECDACGKQFGVKTKLSVETLKQ
jgi:transcription elongation factor Elf1